ncbi:hypothetical protein U9R62_13705 [Cylindrospermopsis raciborskii DSH]|uniref:hypothetical protein n=1 Tax=Cylindrospermopsis raciborskii TaxID=77022 RepID=UPI002EDB7D96
MSDEQNRKWDEQNRKWEKILNVLTESKLRIVLLWEIRERRRYEAPLRCCGSRWGLYSES